MSKKLKAPAKPAKVASDSGKPRARKSEPAPGGDLNFGVRNYTALGVALVFILLGFFMLARGSITAAPILLILGYCVLIPYGLATGRRATSGE